MTKERALSMKNGLRVSPASGSERGLHQGPGMGPTLAPARGTDPPAQVE